MAFPSLVNSVAGVAVEGDFASSNPRSSLAAGQGQFVSDGTVIVGRFVWIKQAETNLLTSVGISGRHPDGFVHRENQAIITTYLGESTMVVLSGIMVTAMTSGDYWAKDRGGLTTVGRWATVFARLTDGAIGCSSAGDASDLTGGAGAWSLSAYVSNSLITVAGDLVKIGTTRH